MSEQRDTKTVISSAKAGDLCSDTTDKRNSRAGFYLFISKPAEQELHSKDIEKRRQGATLPDRHAQLRRTPSAFRSHLHHCLGAAVQNADLSAELLFESGSLQNRRQKLDHLPYRRLWTRSKLISARLQCRLLFPLGSRRPNAGCSWIDLPFTA